MAEQHHSFDSKVTINQTLAPCSSSPSTDVAAVDVSRRLLPTAELRSQSDTQSSSIVSAVKPNRCSTCNRRTRLAGFKCRCGETFCGSHRHPEQHACRFNFKEMGREQILKANPVIIAPKLYKI